MTRFTQSQMKNMAITNLAAHIAEGLRTLATDAENGDISIQEERDANQYFIAAKNILESRTIGCPNDMKLGVRA